MSFKLRAALALALPLTLATVSACTSKSEPTATHAAPGKVGNITGKRLDTAAKKVAESDLPYSLRDSTGAGRVIDPSQLDKYRVCFVRHAEKIEGLDLYVAPLQEKCPKSLGQHVPSVKVPDFTGEPVEEAVNSFAILGYDRQKIVVVTKKEESLHQADLKGLRVCRQHPTAGSPFDPDADPQLAVSRSC